MWYDEVSSCYLPDVPSIPALIDFTGVQVLLAEQLNTHFTDSDFIPGTQKHIAYLDACMLEINSLQSIGEFVYYFCSFHTTMREINACFNITDLCLQYVTFRPLPLIIPWSLSTCM